MTTIKATHTTYTEGQTPSDIVRQAGTTTWSKNWIVIAGNTAIIAHTNTDAVDLAAAMAGAKSGGFNGAARTGMRRRMREQIADYLGVAWQEVRALQREVNADSGSTRAWR